MKIDRVFNVTVDCYNSALKDFGINDVELAPCTVDGGRYYGLFEKLKPGKTRRKRLDYCIDISSLAWRIAEKYDIPYKPFFEKADSYWVEYVNGEISK